MYKNIITIILVFLFTASFQLWTDNDKIGAVQTYAGTVVAIADGEKRTLATRGALHVKDTIAVGEKGFIQIMFQDGTVLAMEENSELELRQFAYDVWNSDENILDFNMMSGGIRFLTGKISKHNPEAFSVETPLGTIGIRGTEGTVNLGLANRQQYNKDLNRNINSPDTDWNPNVIPRVRNLSVQHVNGTASRVMTFKDLFKRVVFINRGEGVEVTEEGGAGKPKIISSKARKKIRPTLFKTDAPIPKDYRSKFSGYAGGGRASPDPTTGNGSTATTSASSSSSSAAAGGGGGGGSSSPTGP